MNEKYAPLRQDAIHVMFAVLLAGGLRFGGVRRIRIWKKGRDLQCGISTLLFIFSFFSASNKTIGRERERDASQQTIQVRCKAKNKSDIINIKIPTQVCMHCACCRYGCVEKTSV